MSMAIKKSGGPKTAEGKLIASRNSLKTGTYSKIAVLPHESQEEFDQLVDQFHGDFYPRDAIELTLIRDLAIITWKKIRLDRLEHAHLIKKLSDPISLEEFLSCGRGFTKEAFQCWVDSNEISEGQLKTYISALEYIRPHLRKNITVEQLNHIKKNFEWVYASIVDAYRQTESLSLAEPEMEDIVYKIYRRSDQQEKYLIPTCFESLIPMFDATIWCANNREEIEYAVGQVKQGRLLNLVQQGGPHRASDDLNRDMIRTINEYRKHHEWRLNNKTINSDELLGG